MTANGKKNGALPSNSCTVVYTSGAGMGYLDPGGWAWVVLGEHSGNGDPPIEQVASGGVLDTTDDRMDLMAVLEAINNLDGQLLIVTASRCITDCIRGKWWLSWITNDWLTETKQPINNEDLWEPIIKAYLRGKVEFSWSLSKLIGPGYYKANTLAWEKARETAKNSRKVVYTTGASNGNPGPGGWAWVALGEPSDSGSVPFEKFASGGEPDTTGNRMDLMAVLEAINSWEDELLIITDSRYVLSCLEQGWWVSWEKDSWLTQNQEPVENQDLWHPIIRAYREGEVEFDWVKKDSGDPGNEAAVTLADQAAEAIAASDCGRLVRGELV